MADNNFNETVESLFKGMDSFLTTKTVVGEAIKFGRWNHRAASCRCKFWCGCRCFQQQRKTR